MIQITHCAFDSRSDVSVFTLICSHDFPGNTLFKRTVSREFSVFFISPLISREMLRGFNLNSSIFEKRIYLLIFNFCVFKKLLWCYNQAENEKSGQCPKGWSDLKLLDKLKSFGQRRDVDMTEGGITRHIVCFAIPLLLGNLFQQFYNTVDSWVVGNYVSDTAFSAVGTVGPIINMLINTFLGLSTGASVVISQFYGAKQHERVQDAVHTSVMMTLILGVVFTIIGIAMTPLMLNLMETPDSVRPEATQYLIIYFSGIISLMLYNMGSGILRAIGDSQRPFYFLVVSALTNVVLDLVFVLMFKMGVSGVAIATVVAQTLSAALVLIVLLRAKNCCRLSLKKLRIHRSMLAKILKVGIPAALQMAVTAFSNVFVQSYINSFGEDCMGGWTAYVKIDQFLFLPMQSISLAVTTFVGQNLGINQVARAKKGIRAGMLMAVACTALLMVPVLIFAPQLVEFFNKKREIVDYGSMLLRLISPFYVFCCINQIFAGALRGAGNSRTPMFIMIGSFVVFRQIYLFIMANYISNTIKPIALSYPAGWLLCSLITALYFKFAKWEKHRVVDIE